MPPTVHVTMPERVSRTIGGAVAMLVVTCSVLASGAFAQTALGELKELYEVSFTTSRW